MFWEYGLCAFVLMGVFMFLFVLVSFSGESYHEDNSSYECGFEPMSLARNTFSYRFFLLSILFLIFDVEVSLMLPLPYLALSLMSMIVFFLFIFVLLVGVVYEYFYGSLEWI